jgi:hypothetical protein
MRERPYRVVVIDGQRSGESEDYAAYATKWEARAIAGAINRAGAAQNLSAEVWQMKDDGSRMRLPEQSTAWDAQRT